jgi:site-specific DNA recombinase
MVNKMAKLNQVVGYARYSTDKQTDNSIAYQKNAIEDYCIKNNISLSGFYVDEGETGTNTHRSGFQGLVKDAEAGLIDIVIVYDVSRGSRDVGDWFTFRKTMMTLGVKVISVTQQLGDLTNPTEFFHELITVGVGQFEVLQTRQKSMAGVTQRAKEGVFLGGIPPLGYDVVNQKYVINEYEAEWVKFIFKKYAEGWSYNKIVDELNRLRARGKNDRTIGKNSLYSILTNERYIGVYTWNKRRVKTLGKWAGGALNPNCVRIENAIPRIINQETWERVQNRMSDNRNNARNRAKKRSYLLSGLIECEACGGVYVGRTTTNNKGYETSSYVCGNKYRTRTCKAKNINANEIEIFIAQHLKEYLRTTDFNIVAQEIADQVNNASPDLSKERLELAQIETQLQNGLKAVLSGLVFPELQDEMDRLRIRKSELEDIIARAGSQRPKVDPAKIVKLFQESIEALEGDNLNRVIKEHITKIYAHVDGSCTVNLGVHLNGCGGRI